MFHLKSPAIRRLTEREEKTLSLIFTSSQIPPTEIKLPFYKIMQIQRYVPDSPHRSTTPWKYNDLAPDATIVGNKAYRMPLHSTFAIKLGTANLHQLPGKLQPSLHRMPVTNKHVVFYLRKGGTSTPKQSQSSTTIKPIPRPWNTSLQTQVPDCFL